MDKPFSRLSVVIFQYDGSYQSNPTMSALLASLENLNAKVTLVCNGGGFFRSVYRENQVTIIRAPFFRRAAMAFASKIFCSLILTNIIIRFWRLIPNDELGESTIIGVDRKGLIEGSFLSEKYGRKFIFISFEIMFEAETSARFKRLERNLRKTPDLVVVQDHNRWSLLSDENYLFGPFTFLPVAYRKKLGSSALKQEKLDQSNIGKLVMMGSLEDWTMAPELARVTSNGKKFSLEFHSKNKNHFGLGMQNLIASSQNISLSDEFLGDFEALDEYLEKFDVGVAFYKPIFSEPFWGFSRQNEYLGANIENIGMASGKFSTYLRAGLPVIVNYWSPEFDVINKISKCIFLCSSPKELPGLVEFILENKPTKDSVIKAFNRCLSFDENSHELMDFLVQE